MASLKRKEKLMSVFFKKRKDGTSAWYYDFMHNGVRYRAVGGTTKTQALRVQEKVRNDLISEEFSLTSKLPTILIEKFAEIYLQRRQHLRSSKRDDLSVRTLLRYFKGKILTSIKPQDIEDYIGIRRNNGLSNATINRELACLKRMYNLAIKWEKAKFNPVNDVEFLKEPPGRTRFLSEKECQKLIQCADNHLKPIIITALNTGMRLGEILSLTQEQVHIDSVINPYIELEQTKNNKKRFVPLNNDMIFLFKSLKNGTPFIFLSTRKKPLLSVRKPFEKALSKAGISNFRFHDLRHTFASHYVMNGGDLLSLKEILGHSDIKMVERYAHLASAHKRKMIDNLNGKFSCHLFATSSESISLSTKKLSPIIYSNYEA